MVDRNHAKDEGSAIGRPVGSQWASRGRWLTSEPVDDLAAAAEGLSLPKEADFTSVVHCIIPKGTRIYTGQAHGGWTQIFVDDPLVLRYDDGPRAPESREVVGDLIGKRVKLRLADPDPGREAFELPNGPLESTISGTHVGPHERTHYYLRLDRGLQLDISGRTVRPVGQGSLFTRFIDNVTRKRRRTNVLSVAASHDMPPPPQDILRRSLLETGRGEAQFVHLVFKRPLPSRVGLGEWQDNTERGLKRGDYIYVGVATMELTNA